MASSNYLKCWYTNATSLNEDKLDELRLLVAQSAPDIIFITETWFDEKSSTTETDIEGYKCFKNNRNNTIVKKGGGVCIYARKHKVSKELENSVELIIEEKTCVCFFNKENKEEEDRGKCKHKNVEQVWCSLTIKETIKCVSSETIKDESSETIKDESSETIKGESSMTFLLGCIYRKR